MLTLTLLGRFQATLDTHAEPLRFPTQKAGALLAFLALRDDRVTRDALATLLWRDVPQAQGRHSLRQELTHIRTALGPSAAVYLHADRSTIGLNRAHIQVDAERLIELVARHTPESLREACVLYRGELLAGIRTREQAFDLWLDSTRADINRLATIALEYCLDEATKSGDTATAFRLATQIVAIDSTNETAQRRLMALHGA